MKSATDMVLAGLALLLLAPLMALIGIAVKLTSPGPALFRQRRYGLNGEEIMVYKFRTMTVCEDGPVVHQATRRWPGPRHLIGDWPPPLPRSQNSIRCRLTSQNYFISSTALERTNSPPWLQVFSDI